MKKVTIDREEFAEALAKAVKFVDETNIIPMYDSMYLNFREGNSMEIIAANERVRIRIDMACKAPEPFALCIPAYLLFKTVSAFRENNVTITHKSEKVVEIKSGKAKYNITMDTMPENYQVMKFENASGVATMHQGLLSASLKTCKSFVDEKHANANLSVINISFRENRMVFTGAQSHYMCRVSPRPISVEKPWAGVSIPVETAKKVINLLGEKGEITIAHSNNKVGFFCTSFEVVSIVHDGKYPDTEKFFNTKPEQFITVSTLELTDAVKRLKLYSGIDEKPTFRISNVVNSQELKLESDDSMGGKNGEEMISIVNPSGLVIDKRFNNEYTMDILSEIDAAETKIHFNETTTCFFCPSVDNPEADIFSFLIGTVKKIEPVASK